MNASRLSMMACIGLLLAACGGGEHALSFVPSSGPGTGTSSGNGGNTGGAPTATVSVDDLKPGSYTVSLGDAGAPVVGKYYASASGERLLVIAGADDQATALYRRAAGGLWVGVPPSSQNVKVTLLRSDAQVDAAAAPSLASVAGKYASLVAPGVRATYGIASDGSIAADASSACKLSGSVSAGAMPDTLKLVLKTQGCGSLPANLTGALVVDPDYAPARFRLIADDGVSPVDLWGFSS